MILEKEVCIKIEVNNYSPYRPATFDDPEEKEEIEYDAYFAVENKGKEILTTIPDDVCEALNLDQDVKDLIQARRDQEIGREQYEAQDTFSAVFYRSM